MPTHGEFLIRLQRMSRHPSRIGTRLEAHSFWVWNVNGDLLKVVWRSQGSRAGKSEGAREAGRVRVKEPGM